MHYGFIYDICVSDYLFSKRGNPRPLHQSDADHHFIAKLYVFYRYLLPEYAISILS